MNSNKSKTSCKRGFTLIELLVVVLIIGILAAVAVPQYQKAVWKSRATQLQTLLSSVVQASNSYFLAHGKWPTSLDELEIDIPLSTLPKNQATCGGPLLPLSVKRTGDIELTIDENTGYHNFISAHFIDGKYKCSGFVHYNDTSGYSGNDHEWMDGRTFCAEYLDNRNCGEYNCKIFCKQVMGKTFKKYVNLINLFE